MKISALLRWADSYPFFYFHIQNNSQDNLGHYRWIIGVGKKPYKNPIVDGNWYMGGFGYAWKAPSKKAFIDFPRVALFSPQWVIASEEIPSWLNDIPTRNPVRRMHFLQSSLDKIAYERAVNSIREDISLGRVYQVNLTLALLWEGVIDPIETYIRLLQACPTTFNYIFKYQHKYVIGASPERFFWQWRGLIAQQPIKGTTARGTTWYEDVRQVESLRSNPKELAENTMIVDLVRNDLQRVCVPGSVMVPVWAEVQSFVGLHHLVSTIYGEKQRGVSWIEAFASMFPAGSMTGAPKRAAMEYIHRYEPVGRGIYSGAVGYITAEGEADFAVVIRSWVYDKKAEKIALQVGSGITYDSDPQLEWEESWLKAEKLLQVLHVSPHLLRS
ncbi:MAG: anthranilate synthase component I family protein [Bacteroidia bacterium]|nr:anthranilate synthase component I family protein [Bacteroidia bacterium]MDW8014983.1 anthranilate synthase component I family protein [Bacteroidia bacterium]